MSSALCWDRCQWLGNGSGMVWLALLQGSGSRVICWQAAQDVNPQPGEGTHGSSGSPRPQGCRLRSALSPRETCCPSPALGGRLLLPTRVDQLLVFQPIKPACVQSPAEPNGQFSARLSLLLYKYNWLLVTPVWAGAFKLWRPEWSGQLGGSALWGFLCPYPV